MRISLIAAACLAAAIPTHVRGQSAAPARLGLCAACHGTHGHAGMPGVPNLAGQRLDYLRDALKQYRDGRRNVPVMRAALGSVSDADLEALARWYSVQSPQPQDHP